MSNLKDDAARLRKQLEEMEGQKVRVALFGQPGAGKSSLINALLGQDVARVGVETDVTVEALAYDWNGIHLVDLPGYDTARFPKEQYFGKFDVLGFDLFICALTIRFREADSSFFRALKQTGKVCLFVSNKSDLLWQKGKTEAELRQAIVDDVRKHSGDPEARVIFTSCRDGSGLDELTQAIEGSLAPAKRERWARGAKAYSKRFLDAKRAACERLVTLYAGISAANGLNPLPGVDVALDIGTLLRLFHEIKDTYGLTDARLNLAAAAVPFQPAVRRIVEYATKEGIILLLKRVAGRQVAKQMTKYVPLVGQAIAAAIGFAVTKMAGDAYLEDCHKVAVAILAEDLDGRDVVFEQPTAPMKTRRKRPPTKVRPGKPAAARPKPKSAAKRRTKGKPKKR